MQLTETTVHLLFCYTNKVFYEIFMNFVTYS